MATAIGGREWSRDDWRLVLALLVLGIVPKLAALPFAMTMEADAVSRVWIAWRWLDHPEWIAHGVWGPLHTYLLAAALCVVRDPVLAPALLNIGLATATGILLYALTRDRFGRDAGLFVSAAYCVYPVVFRNSLMAVSEIPFTFFVVLSLFLLSRAPTQHRHGAGRVLSAGLALTLACMLRYEGWAAIPLLAWMLRRRPAHLALFVAAALVFPIVWMIGNRIEHGDALYGVHTAARWQIEVEGYNDGLTMMRRVKRFVYYPAALVLGLGPPLALAAGAALWVGVRRRVSMPWVLPFVGLLVLFLVQAVRGELLLRGRYSIVLGTLLLPCVGLFHAAYVERHRRRRWIAIAVLAAMIPCSFLGARLAPRFLDSIFPNDIQAVPRADAVTRDLASTVRRHLDRDRDAFIADFIGWRRSYGIAHATRLHPDRIWVAPGERGATIEAAELVALVERYPTGVLLLQDGSALAQALEPGSGGALAAIAARLEFEPISRVADQGLALHRYRLGAPSRP